MVGYDIIIMNSDICDIVVLWHQTHDIIGTDYDIIVIDYDIVGIVSWYHIIYLRCSFGPRGLDHITVVLLMTYPIWFIEGINTEPANIKNTLIKDWQGIQNSIMLLTF